MDHSIWAYRKRPRDTWIAYNGYNEWVWRSQWVNHLAFQIREKIKPGSPGEAMQARRISASVAWWRIWIMQSVLFANAVQRQQLELEAWSVGLASDFSGWNLSQILKFKSYQLLYNMKVSCRVIDSRGGQVLCFNFQLLSSQIRSPMSICTPMYTQPQLVPILHVRDSDTRSIIPEFRKVEVFKHFDTVKFSFLF